MYPGFVSAPLDSAGDAARESSIQGAIDAAWWENPPGLRSGLNLNFDGSPAYLIRNQHIVAGDSGAWHKYLWFAYVWLKRWPEEDDLPELFFIPSDVVAQAMQRCKAEKRTRPFFWITLEKAEQYKGRSGLQSILTALNCTS